MPTPSVEGELVLPLCGTYHASVASFVGESVSQGEADSESVLVGGPVPSFVLGITSWMNCRHQMFLLLLLPLFLRLWMLTRRWWVVRPPRVPLLIRLLSPRDPLGSPVPLVRTLEGVRVVQVLVSLVLGRVKERLLLIPVGIKGLSLWWPPPV